MLGTTSWPRVNHPERISWRRPLRSPRADRLPQGDYTFSRDGVAPEEAMERCGWPARRQFSGFRSLSIRPVASASALTSAPRLSERCRREAIVVSRGGQTTQIHIIPDVIGRPP